jgi:4-hydroxy-tetrahydrodipicolinate synthase
MGADGGTIASSGVMPEVITKLYRDFLAGNHTECRRVQWMIQDLIATMFAAGNFPEGFRAAVSLRGFNPGPPRFPMSPGEERSLEEAKGRLACLLADCGYAEVAKECQLRSRPTADRQSNKQLDVERIVREVVRKLGPTS